MFFGTLDSIYIIPRAQLNKETERTELLLYVVLFWVVNRCEGCHCPSGRSPMRILTLYIETHLLQTQLVSLSGRISTVDEIRATISELKYIYFLFKKFTE